MVPFNEQKESLKNAFSECHPLNPSLFEGVVPESFNSYFERSFSINEITGLNFYQKGQDLFALPNGLDPIKEKLIRQELLLETEFDPEKWREPTKTVSFGLRSFWKIEEFEALEKLKTEADPMLIMRKAFDVALRILERSPKVLGIVCGPISSGKKSIPENIKIFNRTVFKVGQKIPIFNQLPFEPLLHVVHELIKEDKVLCPKGSSSKFFIDHFYSKVFAQRKKWAPHFISGWEFSTGAQIERQILKGMKCNFFDLQENFHEKIF